jgi:hypothetical protein
VDRLIAEINAVEADGIKLAWQGATMHIHFDLEDDKALPSMSAMKKMVQPTTIPDTQSATQTAYSSTSKGDMSTILSKM